MKDVECPYCHHEYDYCNDEGFEQDSSWEETCPRCNKIFILRGWYVENYCESKADCLNGLADHDYQRTNTIPKKYSVIKCTICGKGKQSKEFHGFI